MACSVHAHVAARTLPPRDAKDGTDSTHARVRCRWRTPKAIASSTDWDDFIRRSADGESDDEVFERLRVQDVTAACDQFLDMYVGTGGTDELLRIQGRYEDRSRSRCDSGWKMGERTAFARWGRNCECEGHLRRLRTDDDDRGMAKASGQSGPQAAPIVGVELRRRIRSIRRSTIRPKR
jgi:hypothetical protein